MNESQGSVFIVDDDESVRNALSRLVRSVGFDAIACESADEFLDHGGPESPACAVLDIRMPGTSGLDLQEEMANNGKTLPIIFVSGHGTVSMSVRAMKAGAIDFIEKPFDDQLLIDAINLAIRKDKKQRDRETDSRDAAARFESLTPREAKVYGLIGAGFLNKQIAMKLGNSEKTIKVHRGRIMTKMGAKNLPGLLRKAQTLGLLSPTDSLM
jgi:FixJ family two-component response regulator